MTSVSLPPSLIQTLPGHVYTDPSIFALEQERIFEAMWFAVARSSDLATAGQFVTKQVGRENVIIVRGRDGNLRAFLNVCRHRGARLCQEESGQVRRNIQCMYHAWTYGLDGALVAAPNLTKMTDINRSEYGLVTVHLREWLGYAWVCLADEPPSFEDEVIGAADERLGGTDVIGGWQVDELAVGKRITYDVKANWKLIIENFMECYHCATIHPELTEMLPEFAQATRLRCSSATERFSPRTHWVSRSTGARASRTSPAWTRTTTAGTTRSRSNPPCSSTWSRTTSSSIGCSRCGRPDRG